jgi:hypothetical protein
MTKVQYPRHTGGALYWDSHQWCDYFESNSHARAVPWDDPPALTLRERMDLGPSIQTFQLGESSDGRRLLNAAIERAEHTSDEYLPTAMQLFIGEEQRHAALLARFLKSESIPLLQHQWTDSMFRFLRRRWNLELSVSVLMTAELVARIYYLALRDATPSPALTAICKHLLRDEMHHLAFHAGILGDIRRNRPDWMNKLWDASYSVFHRITLIVVWNGHKNVFRAGGFSAKRYWKTSQLHLNRALQMIQWRQSHSISTKPITAAAVAR